MTRKDYIALAAAIKEAGFHNLRDDAPEGAQFWIAAVASEVARVLQDDNTRFDRARFLAACGVQS